MVKQNKKQKPPAKKGKLRRAPPRGPDPAFVARIRSNQSPVVQSFALPHEFPPVRYSDNFTNEATAVAQPYNLFNCDFSSPSLDTAPTVPNGQMFAAVFRNCLRSVVYWAPNRGALEMEYHAALTDSVGTVAPEVELEFQGVRPLPLLWLNDAFIGDADKFHPHGNRLYCGEAEGKTGVWMDASSQHSGTFTVKIENGGTLYPFRLVGTSWEPLTSVGTASGSATFTTTRAGYFSFEISMNSKSKVSAILKSKAGSLAHLPMNGVTDKLAVLQSIRTTAASIMITCEASALQKAGAVCGYQAPAGNTWYGFATSGNPYSAISQLSGAVCKELKNGMYGFLRPASVLDFSMDVPIVLDKGSVVKATYSLVPEHEFLIIAAKTPEVGGYYPGGDCYLTACWGVEVRTSDPWFAMIPPQISSTEYSRHLEILKSVPQWHENPLHFSDIVNFLSGAGKKVLKYGPGILGALSKIPSPYSGGLNTAARGLGALGAAIL